MSEVTQPTNGLYPSHYYNGGNIYMVQGENGAIFTKNSLVIGNWLFKKVTVGTTPVEVKVGASVLANRHSVLIQNLDDSVLLYVGNDDVNATTGNGYVIFPKGTSLNDNIASTLSIYVVAPSNISVILGELAT